MPIVWRRQIVAALALCLVGAAAPTVLAVGPSPSCQGLPVTIMGTPGNDRIFGTPTRDVIDGSGGDDVIDGRGATT